MPFLLPSEQCWRTQETEGAFCLYRVSQKNGNDKTLLTVFVKTVSALIK